MTDVRECDHHGYFEGKRCPACDRQGSHALDGERRRRLSTFTSGALRHFPDDAGIEIDEQGWTDASDLVEAVDRTYDWAGVESLAAVIATDPKGRFEAEGTALEGTSGGPGLGYAEATDVRIRAAYGHSVDVDLDGGDGPVPDRLYHGTAPRNLDAIGEEGLRPMNRQLVHLSGTVEDAREVGSRHAADPVVLFVDAAAMVEDGYRIAKRGTTVYTTDRVPPEYLDQADEP